MVFDLSVKFSIFGNFQTIKTETQTVMEIMTALQLENFLPSTYSEVSPVGSQLRIQLLKADRSIQVLFGLNRIDVIFNPITSDDGIPPHIEPDITLAKRIFTQITTLFNKKSTRLAFNTSSLFYELSERETSEIEKLVKVELPYYSQRTLREWNVRLVVKEEQHILDLNETLNIITDVALSDAKIELHDNQDKLIEDKNVSAYKVDFDINTIGEEIDPRFTGEHMGAFIDIAIPIKAILQTQLFWGGANE